MDGDKSYAFHNKGATLEGSGPSGQNGSHPPPLGRTATSGAFGDSFAQVSILDYYREKVPRRRRKRCHGCLSLSGYSWTFLFLALIQAMVVTGLQIAIAVLGRFREGRLDLYVDCLQNSLQQQLLPNEQIIIPRNATFPAFGRDKEIYIYLFIALVLYNFLLCIYALRFQNIVEVYTFMVINVLAMAYACLQVYQFRGFGTLCPSVTIVGYLALANALVLLMFTILFGALSLFIYVEFGWKTYVLVDCNPAMRYYYRVYEIFMSGVKLLILFIVVFSVGQCILILQGNYEFYLTILIALVALVAYPIIYFIVRRESHIGSFFILGVGVLWVAYSVFKIVRYGTRSCPLCMIQVTNAEASRTMILEQIRVDGGSDSGSGSGSGSPMRSLNLDFLNREEEFGNLIMVGVINLIAVLTLIVIFIHYWLQYGKGLKEYFANQPPLFKCKCLQRGSLDTEQTDTQPSTGKHLRLRFWSSSKKKKKDSKRESAIEETYSPQAPEFNLVAPTNPDYSGPLSQSHNPRYPGLGNLPPIQEEQHLETV